LDASGAATITPAQINNGSTDNCTAAADLQLALDKTTFDCSNIGDNTVTLTVTDANGNSQTGTATVTVEDKIKPTVATQNITVQLDANGAATITPAQINNGSTDNCTAAADLQLALDKTTFDCSNVGDNTVTLTVTDANGNSQTGTATVTVQDKIKPTVVTQNITVPLDASGAATITPAQINNGSSDNCTAAADLQLALDKTTFDCSNIGDNAVTLTVTDANGNAQTGTATVTVQDQIKPTVVTQNITVQLDASGAATITPAQINIGSTDNCTAAANLQLALDKTTFDCSNVGDNTVTLTVTDANGNAQTGTATVTVEDNIKPTVVTQDITVQLDASGSASITPAQINNGSSDNCSIPSDSYSLSKTTFDCSNVGANTVTLTVTDANGNSATGTATVTVKDEVKPTVVTQDITVQLDASGSASITPAQINNGSSDNCTAAADLTFGLDKASFDCSNIGDNTVTLTVTDANGNSQTGTATVTVEDKIKPTVVTQDITVQLDASGAASITPAQINNGSSDNCSIPSDGYSLSKTTFDCGNVGANTVTLTVTDANGNSETGTATVTVQDNIKPTVHTQNITVQLDANGTASITAAQINDGSTDNCTAAGDLQLSLDKTSFDCSNVGTNTVTLTVTDAHGNSETGTATVTVQDNIKPTVHTQDITVQLDASGAASITPAQINNVSTDNCSIPSDGYSLSKTTFDCSNVGANTVTLTVTDANGNSETGTATVTVKDEVKPTLVTQDVTVQLDASGSASITPAQIDNGSSDNCTAAADLQLSLDKTSFDCSNIGTNTVTLTVTDANGNSETGTATVTVQDNIKPTVHTQNITVQLDANGSASITAAQINDGSTDNCSIPSDGYSLSKTTFDCSNVGANTVTLTVTDANGNSESGTATVTVQDNINPVASCKSIDVYLGMNGSVTITPQDVDNGSSDNCSVSLSIDKSSFNTTNVGANNVILTATDPSGNHSSCTAVVTVKQRPTTLTYTGDGSEQYSDQQSLTAVLTDQLTGTVLSGKQINFSIGSQSASANTDNSGVASTNLILTQDPASSYTVASSFAGDDIYLSASDNDPFDILQEDARAYYTGALFASTSGTTSSSAVVTLSATIQDITAATGDPAYDPYGGDIRNATVSFIDRDNGNAVIATVPVGLVNSGNLLTGTATYNWSTYIGSGDSKQFTIGIRVNNYYTRDVSDDNSVVTVSKPLNKFITGGGYIVLQNSAGLEAGKPGTKNNFGFNVRYNKSGKNLQGNINTIYRRMENDGLLHVYQVKGNAMTSLGIDGSKTAQHPYPTATFNGKANIRDITDPDNIISVDGNATLQVTMTDRGEPGSYDDIGITLWSKSGGLWYSSNWNSIKTVNQLLAGGNLKVSSGSTTFSQDHGESELSNKPGVSNLKVLVHPNPAPNTFIINTKSNSDQTLVIIFKDALGRILETRYGVPANGSFEIGGKYRPGIYFMQVIQGFRRVTLKLIKLPD
jgi:PKD repeat protein